MSQVTRINIMAAVLSLLVSPALYAGDITGSWKGFLTGADGSSSEVVVDFSASGLPLYSYTNNHGVSRQVELSQAGQTIEYVPSGGGVQRVVVKDIQVGPGQLAVSIMGSFEKALFEYALVPGGLKMRLTTQSTSHFGDKDTIVGGNPNASVAEGVLQKV